MPKYQFNTQNHVRIWFSGNPNEFLNDENQLRMVKFRQKNPRAKMTFIYSSSMLNAEAMEKLKVFCTKQHFTPLDFDTELLAECIEQIDLDMHKTAKMELDAYINQKGGNLAAASDIGRLIAPLLIRGTYSDFDTNIEVEALPDIVDSNGPMLLDIGSLVHSQFEMSFEVPLMNNDIIGIAMDDNGIDPAAKDQLRLIQGGILATYNQGALKTLKQLSNSQLSAGSPLVQLYKMRFFSILFELNPDINITDFRMFLDKSTRNIFSAFRIVQPEEYYTITEGLDKQLLTRLGGALENMTNEDFPEDFTLEEQAIIKRAYVDILKSGLKQISKALLSISPVQAASIGDAYNTIKDIDDPEECYRLLQLPATGQRTALLKDSVVLFSGPMQILSTLLQGESLADVLTSEEKSRPYKMMSFDGNNLFDNFNSGQSLRLGSNVQMFQSKLTGVENNGKTNDMSWMSQGQELIRKREDKLHDAARIIQTTWKNHLEKIKGRTAVEENISQETSLYGVTTGEDIPIKLTDAQIKEVCAALRRNQFEANKLYYGNKPKEALIKLHDGMIDSIHMMAGFGFDSSRPIPEEIKNQQNISEERISEWKNKYPEAAHDLALYIFDKMDGKKHSENEVLDKPGSLDKTSHGPH